MELEYYPMKRSQLLADDYIRHRERVMHFYEHDPDNADDWLRRAEWLDHTGPSRVRREQLAAQIVTYNRTIGNAPAAIASAEALRDERTLVIVGGQQAGLLTGPLLVIYKAITIIQAARQAEQLLQRRVIPLFWIAGEDHDFDEVNHIHLLNHQLQIEKLKLDHPTGRRSPISHVEISDSAWTEVMERLNESLPDSEFKVSLMEKLTSIASASSTLSDAFARTMAWLFGEEGLVLLDSADPGIRRLEGPMFRKLIEEGEPLSAAYETARKRVTAAGYTPQADVAVHGANLFAIHQDERLLLYRDRDRYYDRREEISFTKEELLSLAELEPERLSNNVLTRPLMQDYLLPVLSTVLGPGEISYWALTREAFRTIGGQMPIITPRREFTIIENSVRKSLDRYNFSLSDTMEQYEQKKDEWLSRQDEFQIQERFMDAKHRFDELYSPLIQLVGQIEPGLGSLGDTNKRKILEQIEYLETRANQALRRRFDVSLRHLDHMHLSIWPLSQPQERVYNVAAYLNRYGHHWLHDLLQLPSERYGEHGIVYL